MSAEAVLKRKLSSVRDLMGIALRFCRTRLPVNCGLYLSCYIGPEDACREISLNKLVLRLIQPMRSVSEKQKIRVWPIVMKGKSRADVIWGEYDEADLERLARQNEILKALVDRISSTIKESADSGQASLPARDRDIESTGIVPVLSRPCQQVVIDTETDVRTG
jgi:hypothetical protein